MPTMHTSICTHSHFGQMECLKLIASPHFYEKRIGYLGLSLLLTETEEVLTLVTNSIKLDLNSPNPFVAGLALSAVGNLATEDIGRDLAMDIDRVRARICMWRPTRLAVIWVRVSSRFHLLYYPSAHLDHPTYPYPYHSTCARPTRTCARRRRWPPSACCARCRT